MMNLIDKLLVSKGIKRVSLHTAIKGITHLSISTMEEGFMLDSTTKR